jgi:hypothetical protein
MQTPATSIANSGPITRYAWGEIWTRPGLPPYPQPDVIATLVGLNRPEELRMHIRAAFNNGVTRDDIKEVLLQSAVYCGVPAANSCLTRPRGFAEMSAKNEDLTHNSCLPIERQFTWNGETAIPQALSTTRATSLTLTTAPPPCSAAGLPKHQMLKWYDIVGIPMVDTALALAPSKFGDDIVVESRISEWRRSSFDVEHKVFKGDIVAVECSETRLGGSSVRPRGDRGSPVPQDVIARFGPAARLIHTSGSHSGLPE